MPSGKKTQSLHLSSSVSLQLRGICLINHHQHFVCCVLSGCTRKEARVCKCVCVCVHSLVYKQATLIRLKNKAKKTLTLLPETRSYLFSLYKSKDSSNQLPGVCVCVFAVCMCLRVGDRCLLIRQVCTANSA